MPDMVSFTPQLLGRTEKALNAILDRLLADSGVTEPQWVALSIAVAGGESFGRDQLTGLVAGALKVADDEAYAHIAALVGHGFLASEGEEVVVTEEGRAFRSSIGVTTGEIAERLWGDLPAEDLDATVRVLSTALSRADEELARH
ncbi:MarR family transcriptional regulator [Aeromicrobium ginsengisoli]|uniref:MarR family transcriptional regulator n=1 Tax=Aeromicrobium ginsengisoli TaxID=363867 RepID=A0A5M4FA30_9ACTN|nr:MarR family transcriptional regulator [Aeromicrobium ginsengisoli]KAA1395253.1 MarR family transcriptional regulator [Aeromicrobium ginsengisoli]